MNQTGKQRLGPWQQAWVDSLRHGGFGQCRFSLEMSKDDGPYNCCMGVACRVFIENGGPLREEVEKGGCTRFGEEAKVLPKVVVRAMKFRSPQGFILGPRLKGICASLTVANDCGITFDEIADFVEAHPEAVFTEEA